jgi:hypothetical protein
MRYCCHAAELQLCWTFLQRQQCCCAADTLLPLLQVLGAPAGALRWQAEDLLV